DPSIPAASEPASVPKQPDGSAQPSSAGTASQALSTGAPAPTGTAAAPAPVPSPFQDLLAEEQRQMQQQAEEKRVAEEQGALSVSARYDQELFDLIDINVCRYIYSDYLLRIQAFEKRVELLKDIHESEQRREKPTRSASSNLAQSQSAEKEKEK